MRKNIIFKSVLYVAGVVAFCIFSGCKKEDAKTTEVIPVKVRIAKLAEGDFVYKVRVQGTVKPIEDAIISSRVSGIIEKLAVSEGDVVKSGDILFYIDRKNLDNQYSISQQNLRVAEENCNTVKQDIAIAKITLKKAETDYLRSKTLVASKVVSESAFEDAEAAWQKAQATYQRQEAVLKYTEAQVEQAKNNLAIARKNREDSIIKAPFDATVTEKYADSDEYVSAGSKVLHLENQQQLEVSAVISSLYYNNINKDTELVLSSDGVELARAKVSYRAPSIDPMSRTFEIKAKLKTGTAIPSGALCDIDIILAKRHGVGIDSNAVIARAGGKNVVFIIENNIAKEVKVNTGFSDGVNTEILNADDLKNADIVISGHYFLNNDSTVEIIKGE